MIVSKTSVSTTTDELLVYNRLVSVRYFIDVVMALKALWKLTGVLDGRLDGHCWYYQLSLHADSVAV